MALVFHFLHQPCCLIADSPLPKLKFKATPDSLVDEGWKLLTICLNFSIFETLTVQIRIQTPYNLFLVLGADKIYNSLVWRQAGQGSNLSPSSSPWRSSCKHSLRLFQKTIEGLDCKIMAELLGHPTHLGRRWAGQTGQYRHKVFPSWRQ